MNQLKTEPKQTKAKQYEAHKERTARRERMKSLAGRELGALPSVKNPAQRIRGARNLQLFCDDYLPLTFNLPWSNDHLEVITKIEQAVLRGGLFAMAMPRGNGKTSLCEAACLWAILYGHRGFVALIGSDEGHAANMLDSIKVEVETNERLLDDFPEVVFPIRALEGIHQRAKGQIHNGQQTHIGWTAQTVIFPTIPGSRASGGIINVAGITGSIRGMKHKRHDGVSVRPSLVLIDDPQTDESARSHSQCTHREQVLAGAVLGLAGPGRKISGLAAVTVIQPGDIADRILDREKHPEWQGKRTKMVYSFPTDEDLWEQYSELWRSEIQETGLFSRATEFYREHREAMDAGSDVAWPERYNDDELSAIQHAMNLLLKLKPAAFWAEYQNEPLSATEVDEDLLTAEQITVKVNGLKAGEVPIDCTRLTAFIDVHAKALYWCVCGWADNFTGYVVDYGTEPDQKTPYFTLRDVRRTLAQAAPGAGVEGAIYAGLERLTAALLGREWRRDDGAMMRVDRCLIDGNWKSDVVYSFCRQSPHAALVMPSHGRGIVASSIPMSEYKRKRGDRAGLNWRVPTVAGKRQVRHAIFDANYWKSFVQSRLAVALGDPGCLSLFSARPRSRRTPADTHRLIAEHLTAEHRVQTTGRGRTVDEWKMRGDNQDNHWLDCLVGCAVGAAMGGVVLPGLIDPHQRKARRKVRYSEVQRAKANA